MEYGDMLRTMVLVGPPKVPWYPRIRRFGWFIIDVGLSGTAVSLLVYLCHVACVPWMSSPCA